MPGLIPSSRIGKPGREGLVPSRGCRGGTICPPNFVIDVIQVSAIIPGDILLILPDLVEPFPCTNGLGLCTELGGSYVLTRQPSGIDWKIFGVGKSCNFNTLYEIHLTLRCVGDGMGGSAVRHSILFQWVPSSGGPLVQGNVWVEDKPTVHSVDTITPSYVKPFTPGSIPCVWADYPEANFAAL